MITIIIRAKNFIFPLRLKDLCLNYNTTVNSVKKAIPPKYQVFLASDPFYNYTHNLNIIGITTLNLDEKTKDKKELKRRMFCY